MSGFTKKEIRDHIDRLSDDSAVMAGIKSVLAGMKIPYVKGAPEPKMRDVKQQSMVDKKFNPLWLVELRDNYVRFNKEWFNYYGHQWPELEKQVALVQRMAKEHGIDLSSFSPETFDLSDIKTMDDIFGATEKDLKELIRRLKEGTEIGLEMIDDAKKKRWAKILQRVLVVQRLCREPIPPGIYQKPQKVQETWEALHTIRYMLYTMRSNLFSDSGEMEIVKTPPHLIMAAMVIALARKHSAEKRIDGVLIQLPPGHGKPLEVNTRVLMGNGSRRRLGDVRVGDSVITRFGRAKPVTAVHAQGTLPLLRIETESGRVVRSAFDHPFLTPEGWILAEDLRVGESLALCGAIKTEPRDSGDTSPFSLAGYFVGDGCCKVYENARASSITNADPDVLDAIDECASGLGFGTTHTPERSAATRVEVTNGCRDWLQRVGLAGQGSWTKRVPAFVYTGSHEQVAAFVGAYFECDGNINSKGKARTDHCVEFYSVNRDLLVDVQHLLLRLGINSAIRLKNGRYRGIVHKSWRLSFASRDAVARFYECVPLHGDKARRLAEWAPIRHRFESAYIEDRIVSIERDGESECRCLTVEDDASFTAEDLVVHNTMFSIADRALWHCLHPEYPAAMLHYVKDKAKNRFAGVHGHFKMNTDTGRRRRALFPNITIDTSNKSEQKFFLCRDGKRVCPFEEGNLSFRGIHSRAQGDSFLELTIDDPSDEKEADQAGTRESTNRAMSRTWLARLRGNKAFFVFICTAWHPEDFASRLLKMGRAGDINLAYFSQQCGGPDDGYTPLWAEVCDELKLKAAFMRLGPADYACIYQNNPSSEAASRLARLHFFDYGEWKNPGLRSPEYQALFCEPRTEYWISCDPSGTDKKSSNLAGITMAAFGTLRVKDEDTGTLVDQPKLVFVEMASFHASQTRLSDTLNQMVEDLEAEPDPHSIHRLLIESTGGYHATSEFLEDKHGFSQEVIIRKPPGMGTKIDKLNKYASIHLEVGDVLFPGQWVTDERGDQVLEVARGWEDVATQLLQAGSVKENNMLDCVRQQCQEVGHRIAAMRKSLGAVSNMSQCQKDQHDRKARMYERLTKKKKTKTHRPRNLSVMNRMLG